jgi:hypothetical protein
MKFSADVHRMSDNLIDEVLNALGLPRTTAWHRLVSPLFHRATDRLSQIGLTFDQLILEYGFPKAAEWCLNHWCRDIRIRGQANIPAGGPLLIISNHPGAYDALVIASRCLRQDIHLIASDLPFLRSLRNASQRFFFIPINKLATQQRMAGMLSAARYLKDGGAVLLMGSGTIDPDPAVYPDAAAHLERWTEAVNVFLRLAPQTHVLLTAVSHIVAPQWARHPLTWLRSNGMEKRRIAEFGQVLQQLFFPGSIYLSPRLSFAEPVMVADLGNSPRDTLIQMETSLLNDHMNWTNSFTKG